MLATGPSPEECASDGEVGELFAPLFRGDRAVLLSYLDAALAEAAARDANLVQFFLGDPQGWKKPPPRDDAAELATAEIPIYIHAPYLINVASANNRIRIPSRKNLQTAADAASEIGAAGLVVHGGHVTDDEDVVEGFPRWRKATRSSHRCRC